MTKKQIIDSVIELSGRRDLNDTLITGESKGSFFLHAALKYLDTTQDTPESERWLKKDVSQGDYSLQFQYCRSILQVWAMGSDKERVKLEKKTLKWMKENYTGDPSEEDQGTPVYFAPDVIHLAPQQRTLTDIGGGNPYTGEFTYDYYTTMFGQSYGYNGILFRPVADSTYTLSVLANWFSVMEDDSDVCYWSEVYPNVLIQATLMAIEVYYRNSAGVKDMMAAIEPYLRGIEIDLAREEAEEINQMEG